MIHSNIVPQDQVRQVQKDTLGIISDALVKSFGPKGSNTGIVKNIDKDGVNVSIEYTKDGHTIVKNIMFIHPIERSVQDLLTDLTREIVKEVGDGTTSAIILCHTIFDALCENEAIKDMNPAEIINLFNDAVSIITERIKAEGKECTLDDIYDIALISTNGNDEVASIIKSIYEKFGMDVLVEVGISTEVDTIIKEYDGMLLQTGFTNICFVNDFKKNVSSIRNPSIYCFNDPIDTPEMLALLDKILYENILKHYSSGEDQNPIPTVIFGKAISPDTSSYFQTVVELMNQYKGQIPLLMVTDIHQDYIYEDIARMCGAKFIKKYLNPDLQQMDVDKGLAPTLDTVCDFAGHADLVEADQLKTKIINPVKMFNEDGSYSEEYTSMVTYLETQVERAKSEDAGVEHIARMKRRLYSFKGNMVDYLVGGVTLADRNALKASVEDAIFNCRSAAQNGVGYGANFMAVKVLNDILGECRNPNNKGREAFEYDNPLIGVISDAYMKLVSILYGYSDNWQSIVQYSLSAGCPYNIRTEEYDGKVKSSIRSDIVILETISKILTLMFTCNQYLVQTPAHNPYVTN